MHHIPIVLNHNTSIKNPSISDVVSSPEVTCHLGTSVKLIFCLVAIRLSFLHYSPSVNIRMFLLMFKIPFEGHLKSTDIHVGVKLELGLYDKYR